MSLALARALVLTEVVPWGPVAQALFVSVTKSVSFIQALLQTEAVSIERLEEELSRTDAPLAESVDASRELLEVLPRGLCTRLLAIPLKKHDGHVDVALADARDEHAVRELAHHLKAKVRVFRAPLRKVQEAVATLPRPREDSMVESTLVSMRAPEGIILPPSERTLQASAAAPPPPPPPAAASHAPMSGSASPLPLVRPAPEQQPIPLVRRAAEEPVIELRAPFSRPSGRAIIESAAVQNMRSASTRDEILRLLLEGSMEYARRVVLFSVRKDGFNGLLCTPTMGDDGRIKELKVPLAGPSIFATVASGGTYLGPIYGVEAHKPLLAILPGVSDTVAVAAVRLKGRPLVLVLAEGMDRPVSDVRMLDDLARAAGEAFARILATRGE